MTTSADNASATGLDGAALHQPDTDHPRQATAVASPNPPGENEHTVTAERISLLSWGEGSAPALPSIDNGSGIGVSGTYHHEAL